MKAIKLNKTITESNDRDAEEIRAFLKENKIFLVNLMSEAGSGKTTMILRLVADLRASANIAVMVADLASEMSAEYIEAVGAQTIQIHTDGMVSMDAGMTRICLDELDLQDTDIIILENVRNSEDAVQPDSGAVKNVMVLSVPEGDEKPLHDQMMLKRSDALLITKADEIPFYDFSMEKVTREAKRLNPDIRIFQISSKYGEGLGEFELWLLQEAKAWRRS